MPGCPGRSLGPARLAGLGVAFAAGIAFGDVVMLKEGPPVTGDVVSVDRKSVVVKSKSETRVIPRRAVARVEFGTSLVTGLEGNVYTNADYRVRLTAPSGWTFSRQPGLDITAEQGNGVLFLKALPNEGTALEEGMIKGAIGGMLANVPDAQAEASVETRWAGLPARKVAVHSSKLEMVIFFLQRRNSMVMIGLGVPPEEVSRLAAMIPLWEKSFQAIPD